MASVTGMVTRGADSAHMGKEGDQENFRHLISGPAYLRAGERRYRINWSAQNDEPLIRNADAHRVARQARQAVRN